MSCSIISYAIALSLGMVVVNIVGGDVGDGVAVAVVDGFGAGI